MNNLELHFPSLKTVAGQLAARVGGSIGLNRQALINCALAGNIRNGTLVAEGDEVRFGDIGIALRVIDAEIHFINTAKPPCGQRGQEAGGYCCGRQCIDCEVWSN